MSIWRRILSALKLLIAGLLVIYCLMLLVNNVQQQATFWFWFGRSETMSVAYLALFAFFAGALVMFLAGATLWTMLGVRWKRRIKEREQLVRFESEAHRKAAMLRQKPAFVSAARTPDPADASVNPDEKRP